MARLRDGQHRRRLSGHLGRYNMDLLIGPAGARAPGEDELYGAWRLCRDRVMGMAPIGRRPWAWWVFDRGESPPGWSDVEDDDDRDRETVRLAELGELRPDELAALRESANEARLRVGTDSERISGGWRTHGVSLDVAAVELWERVAAVTSE